MLCKGEGVPKLLVFFTLQMHQNKLWSLSNASLKICCELLFVFCHLSLQIKLKINSHHTTAYTCSRWHWDRVIIVKMCHSSTGMTAAIYPLFSARLVLTEKKFKALLNAASQKSKPFSQCKKYSRPASWQWWKYHIKRLKSTPLPNPKK